MANQKSLLMEIYESIEELSKIGDSLTNPEEAIMLGFWEELKLTEHEVNALKASGLNDQIISGIEKIIKERMLLSFHQFFAVLDGVGDPKFRNEDSVWLGLKLVNKTVNDEPEDEEFLHDQLFDAYWDWIEMKSKK